MKRLLTLLCACALLCTAVVPATLAAMAAQDTYHQDHRTTPKLQFEPSWAAPAGLTSQGAAEVFIEQEGARYGLPADPADLELLEVKESLLGSHYVYQQMLNGIAVDGAQFIVSVAHKDGRVYRVYNNTYPVDPAPSAPGGLLGTEGAYETAWQYLRADGDLLAPAVAKLVYTPVGDTFVLNYVVEYQLSAPYGGWRLTIDAQDGAITQVDDPRLIRKVNPDALTIAERLAAQTGPAGDRTAAFARFDEKIRAEELAADKGTRAQGTGLVFDPDPRTTLLNNNLQDGSSAASFTDAYFTRDLLDLTYSGGLYRVTGPWVNIYNWDSPSTAPSTSATGNWTAVRGNNAFNDAMTYFHLDQSQRYMQSLGFTGATGIQQRSIIADTDGVNGDDNSYFVPSTNRLSYGHGCVDDDEDADVILHEYGHAIQHDIGYWAGGDTGAMGEGFGDYWAGSYSYSTPNGPAFYPNYIYTWDGHGTGNQCWYGRIMNATAAQYVPGTTYSAHQSIPGGFQSDELWSTPLFQSLITLTDLGYPRSEVDQIVLESHFGIGTGPTMRDMANATIATAALLQPGQPHADVFTEKFLVHNIVDIPVVQLQAGAVTLTGPSGANGAADPGETVAFTLQVQNSGALAAAGVSAVLSTGTPLVTILDGSSSYADLAVGGYAVNSTPFSLAIDPAFPCGDQIDLTLTFSFNNPAKAGEKTVSAVSFSLGTGTPLGVNLTVAPNAAVPDANSNGTTSEIVVSGTGSLVTANFTVDVRVIHPNIGDLRVIMTSPGGSSLWLHNRSGGTSDNLIGTYPTTLTPVSPLDQIIGQPLDGTWTLKVADYTAGNTGVLESWGISDIGGHECEEVASPVGDEVAQARFAMLQNRPNPFNPSTTIEFAVPENAGPVTLAVYDVSGRLVRTLASGSLAAGSHQRVWDGRDTAGRTVGSGAYFYRLSGPGFSEARKMILMK